MNDKWIADHLSCEDLLKIVRKPLEAEIDHKIFACMITWLNIHTTTEGKRFCEIACDTPLFSTHGEVRRKIKEGGVKWNGVKVNDPHFIPEFIDPGWGVVQLGKNQFGLVWTFDPSNCT